MVGSQCLRVCVCLCRSLCLCRCLSLSLGLLARDAQAKLALIVAQIYPSVHPICLSVCPRQLEIYGALYSSKFCSDTIIGFFS